MRKNKKVVIDALFMGPKSENRKFFKETMDFLLDEHIHWRRDFHPEDADVISLGDQQREDFVATLEETTEILFELSSKLKSSSMPWFSPRYLGHMNADTLMVANLAYMATILYNPNNVAQEASVATSEMELRVGRQFAKLFGYDSEHAWGHLTADGTISNYESLWIARNLKLVPLAVVEVCPSLIGEVKPALGNDYTEWELLNFQTDEILELLNKAEERGVLEEVRKRTVRARGMALSHMAHGMGVHCMGKLLVPKTRHYSWDKAADVLGIGQDNVEYINVKDNYRMDIDHLQETIDRLVNKKIPILAVVGVVGTTEESAVDEIHKIVELRREYTEKVAFYFHIDAAYGGYVRALFLDKNDKFMDFEKWKEELYNLVRDRYDDSHIQRDDSIRHIEDWIDKDIYDAFKAMSEADSITVDPHKMGYVPYAVGGIVLRDNRVLDLVSYFAPYISRVKDNFDALGSYIMEGSKSGAAAASVWAAHCVIPLNVNGYGMLISQSIEGAMRFYNRLRAEGAIEVGGKRFNVAPLVKPDLNIVVFAFNKEGNESLTKMNKLNKDIYEKCSYLDEKRHRTEFIWAKCFITSKTELRFDNYGDIPQSFVTKLGIPASKWNRKDPEKKCVCVLRSCVMTPYLNNKKVYKDYWEKFSKAMKEILLEVSSKQ